MSLLSALRRPMRRGLGLAFGALLLAGCGDDETITETPQPNARFDAMVAFGGSLEDTGNACNLNLASCPPLPYAPSRFSNGKLWLELVGEEYDIDAVASRQGGTNYAYAGARTGAIAGTTQGVPNMNQQLDAYLAAPNEFDRARVLFVIGGATVGNDINDALVQARTNPQAAPAIIGSAVANISQQITRLYAAGARHILVMNSTDIGLTPLVRAQGAPVMAAASALSTQFNSLLATQIASIRTASAGLNVYLLDVGTLTAQVAANPSQFGFTNVTASCVVVQPPTLCTTPDSYFYWDSFHPTAATGRLVSTSAIALVGPNTAAN